MTEGSQSSTYRGARGSGGGTPLARDFHPEIFTKPKIENFLKLPPVATTRPQRWKIWAGEAQLDEHENRIAVLDQSYHGEPPTTENRNDDLYRSKKREFFQAQRYEMETDAVTCASPTSIGVGIPATVSIAIGALKLRS